MKRLTLWFVGIFASLFVLLLITVVIFVLTGNSRLDKERQAWQDVGGVNSVSDHVKTLNADVTESDLEAADLWQQAMAALPSDEPELLRGKIDFDTIETAQLESILSGAEHALRLTDQAAQLAPAHWPVVYDATAPTFDNFYGISFPYSRARTLSRYLRLRAMLDMRNGETDTAVQTVKTGYALADFSGAQPAILPYLVDISLRASMLDLVRHMMDHADGIDSMPDLSSLDAMLDAGRPRTALRAALLGEGAFGQTAYKEMGTLVNQQVSGSSKPSGTGIPRLLSVVGSHDQAEYLIYMRSWIEYVSLPAVERSDTGRPEMPPSWALLASIIVSALDRANAATTQIEGNTLLARQAIQLTEYYREHKAFPASEDFQSLATNEAHGFVITNTLSDDGHTVTLGCEPHPDLNTKEADAVSKETWELTW
ncbi:MAG: hypothetical protein HND57_13240 [Planctomycetes bacterium]|nr:hypothetical protein [Planctomycetota bacterium]